MTITVKRIGGSLAVVIPRAIAAESQLEEGMPLEIKSTAEGILFQSTGRRPRRSMEKIAKQIKPSSYSRRNAELLREQSVGKELG